MRQRKLLIALAAVAVAAAIGPAAVTLGPIAYSQVFRGVGDPHAPADRIQLKGRRYYLSKWPGADPWQSMLDHCRADSRYRQCALSGGP